jgi:hypothetical protein
MFRPTFLREAGDGGRRARYLAASAASGALDAARAHGTHTQAGVPAAEPVAGAEPDARTSTAAADTAQPVSGAEPVAGTDSVSGVEPVARTSTAAAGTAQPVAGAESGARTSTAAVDTAQPVAGADSVSGAEPVTRTSTAAADSEMPAEGFEPVVAAPSNDEVREGAESSCITDVLSGLDYFHDYYSKVDPAQACCTETFAGAETLSGRSTSLPPSAPEAMRALPAQFQTMETSDRRQWPVDYDNEEAPPPPPSAPEAMRALPAQSRTVKPPAGWLPDRLPRFGRGQWTVNYDKEQVPPPPPSPSHRGARLQEHDTPQTPASFLTLQQLGGARTTRAPACFCLALLLTFLQTPQPSAVPRLLPARASLQVRDENVWRLCFLSKRSVSIL